MEVAEQAGTAQVVSETADTRTLADFVDDRGSQPLARTHEFKAYIDGLRDRGEYAYHRCATSMCDRTTTVLDDSGCERAVIVMNSNNYLGLNGRPEVQRAAIQAIHRYGAGMGGSRFLCGTYDLVVRLEERLAAFERGRACMVFTTGYQANVGTISALMRPGDIVFIDRLCHASIVDGCRLSGCKMRTFRHNDVEHLGRLLEWSGARFRCKLVVVDGVFSMHGDVAPLPAIVAAARKHGALTMVDEAHATGVLGPTGRGTVEHFGLEGQVDIVMGTFSKSLASTGGYIVASPEIVNYVRHYGRSYMFSASPTPAVSASVLAALDIVEKEPELRERLWSNVRFLHSRIKELGLSVDPDPPQSAILTVPVGSDAVVHAMSRAIYEQGIWASTVVYPAVPRDRGLIRISVMATHTEQDLDAAAMVLQYVARAFGITSRGPCAN